MNQEKLTQELTDVLKHVQEQLSKWMLNGPLEHQKLCNRERDEAERLLVTVDEAILKSDPAWLEEV